MAFPVQEPVSADAFLRWAETQQDRFELAGGRILRLMAGAKQSHNVVAANILAALLPQVRRVGCRTTASDTAVRTGPAGVRYPDVVVDCGPPDPNALEASRPVLVVEVTSAGTSAMDATDKLDEYQMHEDIRLIMLVEPDIMSVKLYRRGEDLRWAAERYDDLSQTVMLPEIRATLTLADIYESLRPDPRPSPRPVGDTLN